MSDHTLSYSAGVSTKPLIGQTIGAMFDTTAANFTEREALVVHHQNLRLTYSELKTEIEQVARSLLAIGVKPGDRVGIWSPNCAQWIMTQIATAKIGAILVNINPAYRIHELEHALNQSGTRFLITAESFKSSNYIEMLNTLCAELNHCEPGRLASSRLPYLEGVVVLSDTHHSGTWR